MGTWQSKIKIYFEKAKELGNYDAISEVELSRGHGII